MQIVSNGDNLHGMSKTVFPLETICIICPILFSEKNKKIFQQENRIGHFMQLPPFSGKTKKNISICCLLKILSRTLSINKLH